MLFLEVGFGRRSCCRPRDRRGECDVEGQLRGVNVRGQVALQSLAGGIILDEEGVLHAQFVSLRQLIVAAQERENPGGYHLCVPHRRMNKTIYIHAYIHTYKRTRNAYRVPIYSATAPDPRSFDRLRRRRCAAG